MINWIQYYCKQKCGMFVNLDQHSQHQLLGRLHLVELFAILDKSGSEKEVYLAAFFFFFFFFFASPSSSSGGASSTTGGGVGSLLLLLLLLLCISFILLWRCFLNNWWWCCLLLLFFLDGNKETNDILGLDHVIFINLKFTKDVINFGLD